MKITYDLEYLPERKKRGGGRESEEVTAIKVFLAGRRKNLCFEYDDEEQAKRRYECVMAYRRRYKLQEVFDIYRSDNCVYVLRSKKKSNPDKWR